MRTHILFAAAEDNAVSEPVKWNNNRGAIFVQGGFDSGTVTLEFSKDNGATWNTTGTAFTAAGVKNVDIRGECHLRAAITSVAAASASLTVTLDIVDELISPGVQ